MMLEINDIQHFLISRPPALAARYEFLTFRGRASGRDWLKGILDKVGTAKAVASQNQNSRWVTVGFTWNGLRALGVDEAALATFPEEFRQGMAELLWKGRERSFIDTESSQTVPCETYSDPSRILILACDSFCSSYLVENSFEPVTSGGTAAKGEEFVSRGERGRA